MAEVQVTCITKPHPQSQHEHITHVGNPKAGWKWTREQVIESIDSKANIFFVLDPKNGKRADIGVVRAQGMLLTCAPTRMGIGTTTCCRSINAPCELEPTKGWPNSKEKQYVEELPHRPR